MESHRTVQEFFAVFAVFAEIGSPPLTARDTAHSIAIQDAIHIILLTKPPEHRAFEVYDQILSSFPLALDQRIQWAIACMAASEKVQAASFLKLYVHIGAVNFDASVSSLLTVCCQAFIGVNGHKDIRSQALTCPLTWRCGFSSCTGEPFLGFHARRGGRSRSARSCLPCMRPFYRGQASWLIRSISGTTYRTSRRKTRVFLLHF